MTFDDNDDIDAFEPTDDDWESIRREDDYDDRDDDRDDEPDEDFDFLAGVDAYLSLHERGMR